MTHPLKLDSIMKVLYPASYDIPNLRESQLALKIARHSPCSACDVCFGLHPPPDIQVLADDDPTIPNLTLETQSGSDDEDIPPLAYLETCECGHSVKEHGADETEQGPDEFARRGRVAVRLDELLQV